MCSNGLVPTVSMARLLPLLICLLISVVHSVPAFIYSWDDDPDRSTLVESAGSGLAGAQQYYCPACVTTCVDPKAVIPGRPHTREGARVLNLGQQDAVSTEFSSPEVTHLATVRL